MVNTFLSYLILFGIKSNVMVFNGSGVLEFQREKMYRKFRYFNALFTVLGIILTAFADYFLTHYVYGSFNFEFARFSIIVLIAGIYNIIVNNIWKKTSTFNFYLYEKSYSFAFDLIYMVATVLMLNTDVAIVEFALQLLAVAIVVMFMNIVIGFFVRTFNRGYMNINFRSVSARLFFFGILSILFYYAGLLV
ncbi:MAG: hypothetical protein IJ538_04695 [Clostridia bacterium]|nr:hypothetical protein [Clostridia bacterium]